MSAGTFTPYRAVGNAVYQGGTQVAVVLASNCTKKLAREMAAYAAQQANHDAMRKARICSNLSASEGRA